MKQADEQREAPSIQGLLSLVRSFGGKNYQEGLADGQDRAEHAEAHQKRAERLLVEIGGYAAALAAQAAPMEDTGPLGYAARLAESMWRKHYQQDAPNWQVCPDLLGVLTQIDNMTTGLMKKPAANEGTLTAGKQGGDGVATVAPPSMVDQIRASTEYVSWFPIKPAVRLGRCGSYECRAAQRDGVICADDECRDADVEIPITPPGVPAGEKGQP